MKRIEAVNPKRRAKRARGTKPMKRGATLKARKVPRAFRQRRDPAYTKWVRAQPCLVAGRDTTRQLSLRDRENVIHSTRDGEVYSTLTGSAYWHHVCWGPIDPAHVGKHRAQGAPDAGAVVPLCRAAHQAYDEHRDRWDHLVSPSVDLADEAARLYQQYLAEVGRA